MSDQMDAASAPQIEQATTAPQTSSRFVELPLSALKPNTWNFNEMDAETKDAFFARVKDTRAISKPIKVRTSGLLDGNYEIIDGEHNYLAAVYANLPTVPCEVLELDLPDAIAESFRSNRTGTANKLKLARSWMMAMHSVEPHLSAKQFAKKIGVTAPHVGHILNYAKLAYLLGTRPGLPQSEAELAELGWQRVAELLKEAEAEGGSVGGPAKGESDGEDGQGKLTLETDDSTDEAKAMAAEKALENKIMLMVQKLSPSSLARVKRAVSKYKPPMPEDND